MQLFRRFLVAQALMLWQGGFLFYAAVVVPTGTNVLGSFDQGRVTRHVTDAMNVIGAVTVLVLTWDQWTSPGPRWLRWSRWAIWTALLGGLVALAVMHPRIEGYVDFGAEGRVTDYPTFYLWHRLYLYVATVQWVASLGYVVLMLHAWSANPQAAKLARP
jgi:hypothetical protein